MADCPFVRDTHARQVTPTVVTTQPYEIMRGETLKKLQAEISAMDLGLAAEKLGGRMNGDKLSITCLGKEFLVDAQGAVTSECHTHMGLAIPLLSYVAHSRGGDPTGNWTPFRELKDALPMSALFEQRGEKRLRILADEHTDLFDDLIAMFSGRAGENRFSADISVILRPLPKLPVLICYWQPEEGLDSQLGIFLDATADRHLAMDSIFELVIGMVMMFEKIAQRHV